jgi:hypothetical protein
MNGNKILSFFFLLSRYVVVKVTNKELVSFGFTRTAAIRL